MGSLIPPRAIADPVHRILGRFNRDQISGFISVAIDLLDLADGDPDSEDGADDEPETDDAASFPEFDTLPKIDQRAGRTTGRFRFGNGDIEDAEDDDPEEDDDPDSCVAGDDCITAGVAPVYRDLAAKAGWHGRVGDDDDAESDRPMLGAAELEAAND